MPSLPFNVVLHEGIEPETSGLNVANKSARKRLFVESAGPASGGMLLGYARIYGVSRPAASRMVALQRTLTE